MFDSFLFVAFACRVRLIEIRLLIYGSQVQGELREDSARRFCVLLASIVTHGMCIPDTIVAAGTTYPSRPDCWQKAVEIFEELEHVRVPQRRDVSSLQQVLLLVGPTWRCAHVPLATGRFGGVVKTQNIGCHAAKVG